MLVQNRNKWQAPVNAILRLRFAQSHENLLTSRWTSGRLSFSLVPGIRTRMLYISNNLSMPVTCPTYIVLIIAMQITELFIK